MTTTSQTETLPTVTFPDGAVWRRESDTAISYVGPFGSETWEWPTAVECSAAWLAVCLH